jgi:hypothetical protein
MASNLSIALGIFGPALTCGGVLIQFYDWKKSREESDKLSWLRDYIAHLDSHIGGLRAEDKSRGLVTEQGLDIGETFEILQKAAEEANKINRAKLQNMVDQVDASSKRRAKYVGISIALVLLGTALWALSSFV